MLAPFDRGYAREDDRRNPVALENRQTVIHDTAVPVVEGHENRSRRKRRAFERREQCSRGDRRTVFAEQSTVTFERSARDVKILKRHVIRVISANTVVAKNGDPRELHT